MVDKPIVFKDNQGQKTKEVRLCQKMDWTQEDLIPFPKRFYIESETIANMPYDEVVTLRKEKMEGCTIRGKGCPKPIVSWSQCGLPEKVYEVLGKHKYKPPFPIQAQAIPALMSGRDVIGCAKTGSGKTLAFVLPMIRHVRAQRPREEGDGPMALILSPTRELCIQIYKEINKFAKNVFLKVVACYGGSDQLELIADLKRGVDILVATPGRLIDMLTKNSGRILNLKRVTYFVLDEADRMFDMGFQPQIEVISKCTRPDKQTAFFSATFPKSIQKLARSLLRKPIEIMVGKRSKVSNTIKQEVFVLEEEDKFAKLCKLLNTWVNRGLVLIFVQTKEMTDMLFLELEKNGYPCFAIHGGMDQADRDATLVEFRRKRKRILVGTSILARGLDVPDIRCVINYTVPSHYEDYVHKVGRTGRADQEGNAFTFITPEEDRRARDLIRAFQLSGQEKSIPEELQKMSDEFKEKIRTGEERPDHQNSGFQGSGFKFDATEQKKHETGDPIRIPVPKSETDKPISLAESKEDMLLQQLKAATNKAKAGRKAITTLSKNNKGELNLNKILKAKAIANSAHMKSLSGNMKIIGGGLEAAKRVAQQITLEQERKMLTPAIGGTFKTSNGRYVAEVEINPYPQSARSHVTKAAFRQEVQFNYDISLYCRGVFVARGRKPPVGQRPLYLRMEGSDPQNVENARIHVVKTLGEIAAEAGPEMGRYAKFSL